MARRVVEARSSDNAQGHRMHRWLVAASRVVRPRVARQARLKLRAAHTAPHAHNHQRAKTVQPRSSSHQVTERATTGLPWEG
eukprot:scaffold55221_cov28-Tisochrysis_lutea.AAC.2